MNRISNPIKCVLVGNGQWGKIVQRYIHDHEYFELVGNYTEKSSRGFLEFLLHTEADVAFICSPQHTHYMYSKTAIENGLDVFCEKPLTADFQEAEELFTLAEREGKVLYTDYEYINSPSVNRIKEMIDQLVEIQCIRMTMCQFGRFYSDSTAMETLGVHLLSIIEYLFPNYRYSINSVFEWSVEGGSDLTSQTVLLIVNDIPVELHVSLACPRKERQIRILSRNRIVSCNMMGETNLDKLFIEDGNISFESTDYFDNEKDTVSYSINEFCEYVKNRTVINRNWMISRKVEEVLHAIKDTKNHQPTLC